MEAWLVEGLKRLGNFMIWDGIALVVFGAIILLGIKLWHPRTGLIVASAIPVANIILWGVYGQPFLLPITMIMMLFMAVLMTMPIFFESVW